MSRPRAMYAHGLDVLRGNRLNANLQFDAKLSANVTIDPVYAGRVVHLNSDGEFEMGCTGHQMAIFLLPSSDDPDVEMSSGDDDQQIIPNQVMTGIVATCSLELSTTEFDTDQDYAPNEGLRAIASNSNSTTGGRLTNQGVVWAQTSAPENATAICGLVSSGVVQNSHKKSTLRFWPIWEPGADGL